MCTRSVASVASIENVLHMAVAEADEVDADDGGRGHAVRVVESICGPVARLYKVLHQEVAKACTNVGLDGATLL